MPSYIPFVNVESVPGVEAKSSGVSFESLQNSFGVWNFLLKRIFFQSGTKPQLLQPITFTSYDSNGMAYARVLANRLDPYQDQAALMAECRDLAVMVNGRTAMTFDLLIDEFITMIFHAKKNYLSEFLRIHFPGDPSVWKTSLTTPFSFYMSLKNNTGGVVPITVLTNTNTDGFFNSPIKYQWDMTAEDFINAYSASIEVAPIGSALVTYTVNIITPTVDGTVAALNSLNVGVFVKVIVGSSVFIVTYSDTRVYGTLVINKDAAPVWSSQSSQQVVQAGTSRHIVDNVYDTDGDTIAISFINLPSFCTATTVIVPGISGRSVTVVDITVNPASGDSGSYDFTMRAQSGLATTDKAINLLVNASAHLRFTVRNATNVSLNDTGGLQSIGSLSSSLAMNLQSVSTTPATSALLLFIGSGPGALSPSILPTPVTSIGKYVMILGANNTAADGTRVADQTYWIITVT